MIHRAILISALFTVAAARAEPIVILASPHNLNYAQSICDVVQKNTPTDTAAITDCALVPNTRGLGRRLEYEVESRFAVNTRCKGVTVLRMNDFEYDGKFNDDAQKIINGSKPHWKLLLDYQPGSKVHGWSLHRGDDPMKAVGGEGTPAQIADEVCIVVTGQGANIP
jgi:hypothetical protein